MSAPDSGVLAKRVGRLGTETAFAVSAEAAEWKALGHTVYPFHLGDMDLATPGNIVEAAFQAIARRQDRLLPQRRHPRSCERRWPTTSRPRTASPTRRRTSPSSRAASR